MTLTLPKKLVGSHNLVKQHAMFDCLAGSSPQGCKESLLHKGLIHAEMLGRHLEAVPILLVLIVFAICFGFGLSTAKGFFRFDLHVCRPMLGAFQVVAMDASRRRKALVDYLQLDDEIELDERLDEVEERLLIVVEFPPQFDDRLAMLATASDSLQDLIREVSELAML